jgi:DedD protein
VNSLLHREGDDDLDDLNGTKDREITLGTTMILGIFFALAVLCAVFFGFGYQLGHKSVVTSPVPTNPSADTQPATNFAGFKPAAGNPAGSTPEKTSAPSVAVPYAAPAVADSPAPRPTAAASDDASADLRPSAPRALPTSSAASVPATAASPSAGTGSIVQIAAVSHQEDADLLVTTLKRRGYNVAIRTEPQDKLLHVQVGPFASHQDADAMRQKLLADGFNAIVKDTK